MKASVSAFAVAMAVVGCQSSRGPFLCVDDSVATQARTENMNWRGAEALPISRDGFNGTGIAFEPHSNYLAMPLPFPPMKKLYEELVKRSPVKLLSRGESHVTVLTPPEFDELKSKLSMADINAIATKNLIQETKLTPVCLGQGRGMLDGKEEQAFFVVIEASGLVKVRRAIADAFRARGGSRESFNPDHFYPHITVGFTKADLHEQNGVIKDAASCLSPLRSLN
jgi:2'-5' RNA ligase